MSDANREQITAFLNSTWKRLLEDVSASRDMSEDDLKKCADDFMMFSQAETYIANGLADTLLYKDGVLDYLKTMTGCEADERLHTLSLNDMKNVKRNVPLDKSGNIIAVYYAFGGIDDNTSTDEGINSEKVIKDLRKLREDETIKAVVLRVNSPGGSAYGSEQIWREVVMLKNEKPVIVSMGDYAASGGYYISCGADYIYAEPTTITGSIGIFGTIPSIAELREKIGLDIDGITTNKHSGLESNIPYKTMTAEETQLMQNMVERGYELFTTRCADGRGVSQEYIKSVGEGRVWLGTLCRARHIQGYQAPQGIPDKLPLGESWWRAECLHHKGGYNDSRHNSAFGFLESGRAYCRCGI
jgi:protease-4